MKNEDIIKIVSDTFGVSAVRLSSKDRSQDVTTAKIAYCGLVRDIQKATTTNLWIGVSAPSIRKYVKECDELIESDNDFARRYARAQKQIEQL